MPRDGAPERKDERGQDRHSADNAQQHALGHYDADVAPQCQAHGAHCEEACDGGERTCQNGGIRHSGDRYRRNDRNQTNYGSNPCR